MAVNFEIINKWRNELKAHFINKIEKNINPLEKSKAIKNNILYTLEYALKLANYSSDEKLYNTKNAVINIQEEISNIKKDTINISIFGQMKAGKSSFINALVGEDLLAVKKSRATSIISIIRHIDNFPGHKDGDIEVTYKSESHIVELLDNYMYDLSVFYPNDCELKDGDVQTSIFDSFILGALDEYLNEAGEILEKIKSINTEELGKDDAKKVKDTKTTLKYILNKLQTEESLSFGKTVKIKEFDKDFLTNDKEAIFVDNVVFYKNKDLLKNIELVDTPGLGSSSSIDTQTSKEYLEKADIILLLTNSSSPMQLDPEHDILGILKDLEKNDKKQNVYDKVFLILSRIDELEDTKEDSLTLLDEELENFFDGDQIGIKNDNIFFMSSRYELQKRVNNIKLDEYHWENNDNKSDNYLNEIQKAIYRLSTVEATSIFLQDNILKIDNELEKLVNLFKENLSDITKGLRDVEKNIVDFKNDRKEIEKDLKKKQITELEEIRQELKSSFDSTYDKIYSQYFNNNYFIDNHRKPNFKSADRKNYKIKIKDEISYIQSSIIYKELSAKITNYNASVSNKLIKEIVKIREKFIKDNKEKYTISMYLDSYNIPKLSFDVKFEEKLNIRFLNTLKGLIPFLKNRYVYCGAEAWEKYTKVTLSHKIQAKMEEMIDQFYKSFENQIKSQIKNMLNDIAYGLEQKSNDKKNLEYNREDTISKKKTIKTEFQIIKNEYIDCSKKQVDELKKEVKNEV